MLIKKVNHNTFDLFLGEGWEGWSRWKIKFGKDLTQLFQIKGTHVPKSISHKLHEQYNSK